VQSQAACATATWRQPDQRIWEARGEPRHYVSSKLMCTDETDDGLSGKEGTLPICLGRPPSWRARTVIYDALVIGEDGGPASR